MELSPFRKFIVAIVGAAINFAQIVIFSEPTEITAPEWFVGTVGLATALGVYQVANAQETR